MFTCKLLLKSRNVFVSLLGQDLSACLSIKEEMIDLINLVLCDFRLSESFSKHEGWSDHLNDVTERCLGSNCGQVGESVLLNLNVLDSTPDGQDLDDLVK